MTWPGPRWWIAAALLLVVAAGAVAGWWYFYSPRVITVSIFPDYAFRQRSDWKERLESRMAEVSRIFESTGVRWKVASIESDDPANSRSDPMDVRRLEMARDTRHPADVLLIVTGLHEGARTGSVNPFSHGALVADFPNASETRNTLLMAQELAHLFGAPREPGSSTVMALEPNDSRFSDRAKALIHRLRRYDFKQGISAMQGQWDGRAMSALTDANRGLQPNPVSQAHQVLAAALVIDGRYGPGIQHLQEALKLEPKVASVRMQLAVTLMQDTQPDAAIAVLRDGIKLNGDDSRLHSLLASMLARRDFEGAVAEYNTAIRLDPKNAGLYDALGTLQTSGLGRIDGAIASFQQALRLNPNLPRAVQGLARAQQLKENAHTEVARITQQANADRASWNLQYTLGVAYLRGGEIDAAIKALSRAAELNPREGRVHSTMALAHFLREDYRAAQNELEKARQLGTPAPQEFATALQARMGSK